MNKKAVALTLKDYLLSIMQRNARQPFVTKTADANDLTGGQLLRMIMNKPGPDFKVKQ